MTLTRGCFCMLIVVARGHFREESGTTPSRIDATVDHGGKILVEQSLQNSQDDDQDPQVSDMVDQIIDEEKKLLDLNFLSASLKQSLSSTDPPNLRRKELSPAHMPLCIAKGWARCETHGVGCDDICQIQSSLIGNGVCEETDAEELALYAQTPHTLGIEARFRSVKPH